MEDITETTTNQNAEAWNPVPTDESIKHIHTDGSGSIAEEGAERLEVPEYQGVCSGAVSPSNVNGQAHSLPTVTPKQELNKDAIDGQAKMDA